MKNRHLPAVALASLLLLTPLGARCQEGPEAALAAAREGRTEEALEMVDAALTAAPDDVAALFTRGVILAEAGRRGDAEEVFRGLIERHPELPEAYNNLAVLQASAGDFDGAVSTLRDALATNASYETAYNNLTRIFAQLASEAYSRALEVDSPPEREQVELQMLAALSAPPVVPARLEQVAEQTAEEVTEPVPVAAGEVESEDLEVTEIGEPSAAAAANDTGIDSAGLVEQWARAWSEQRVDDYLAFYADGFLPDNGMSRIDWEESRRERIGAPEFIKVEVAILDSSSESPDREKVTFLQAYESNTYRDQVTKTLTLVRDGAHWKILEEKSGS